MDETHSKTDATSRKRRSSILKSQRPPRTPFCELEFNVTTPPDTTKSRRVSFSRRTGVAEFVTNEATTTWKNFYEEHNKSLESSGNDSGGANANKQTISHLGKRIFDEQFEEVETIDFIGGPNPGMNVSTSINTLNFGLECTDKLTLTAPQNNFELSAFTEHRSKVFGDDLVAPCIGEVSNCIDVNFSAIQHIGDKDDLDEIQRDVQNQGTRNVMGLDSQNGRQSLSEYIEVDLNVTQAAVAHDESDMSITDIINSPKVQDVSKSCSIDKKVKLEKDWVADKENIAINPYVAPKESLNFAINDEPDEVLVFDGKKLTVQRESKVPQRKTIVLNCDDDLPNFVETSHVSRNASGILGLSQLKQSEGGLRENSEYHKKQNTVIYDDDLADISITKPVSTNVYASDLGPKRQTVVFDNSMGNKSSLIQVVSAQIIENPDKTSNLLNESGNISLTRAVTTNLILDNENNEKGKTIVFQDDACNISMTQALPDIFMAGNLKETRKTIVYEDGVGNLSITQAIPNIVIKENKDCDKRRTIVFAKGTGDISITQALTSNIILNENAPLPDGRRMLIIGNESNISMTRALPSNIIMTQNSNDISMIDPFGADKSIANAKDTGKYSIVSEILNQIDEPDIKGSVNKRRTVVFENEEADISMTQAVNLNCVIPGIENHKNSSHFTEEAQLAKRRTIIFETNDADISMTQAVNLNQFLPGIISEEKQEINSETRNHTDVIALSLQNDCNIENVLYKNENVKIKQADSATYILPNVEPRQESPIEDKLSMKKEVPTYIISENRSRLIDINKLTDESHEEPKQESDNHKTNVLDVSMVDVEETLPLRDSGNELSIERIMSQKVNTKQDIMMNMSLDDITNMTKSKPIPDLPKLQNECLKSLNKDFLSLTETKLDETNTVSDVIVYQTANINDQNKKLLTFNKSDGKRQSTACNGNDGIAKTNIAYETPISDQMSNKIATKQDDEPVEECKSIREMAHSTETVENLKDAEPDVQLEPIDHMEHSMETVNDRTKMNASNEKLIPTDKCKSSRETVYEIKDENEAENFPVNINVKKSVLKDLLDMSNASLLSDGIDDKNIMAKVESQHSAVNIEKPEMENASKDTLFYIIRDEDGETKEADKKEITESTEHNEEEPELVEDFQRKLNLLKSGYKDGQNDENNFENKICISGLEKERNSDLPRKDTSPRTGKKSFKLANDTNELLEMLSDFTDKPLASNLDPHLEEDEDIPEPVVIKGHIALENKLEIPEPESRIAPPRRKSNVFSREELLHSLSIAGAALQKSAFDLDDSENMEDSVDSPQEQESYKKSVRISNDVVKELKFDDSLTETNEVTQGVDTQQSPLKKTAVGDISFRKEKAKVIPDYMKDVSDGVKELIDDLVKPMADVMPFESVGFNKSLKKSPSTCSTQIQANLVTSSQIDVSDDLNSSPNSYVEITKMSSAEIINEAVHRSLCHALKSPFKSSFTSQSVKSLDMEVDSAEAPTPKAVSQANPTKTCEVEKGNVIIFDHANPLNNILLPPPETVEVHKYDPVPDTQIISEPANKLPEVNSAILESVTESKTDECDIERVAAQYHIESVNLKSKNERDDSRIALSSCSKPMSVDQFTEVVKNVTTAEVNTLIAMKANKELLEASSSLTLVEDELGTRNFHVHVDSNTIVNKKSNKRSRSPVEVIYNKTPTESPEKDSEVTSSDELDVERHRAHKRYYSPARRDKNSLSKSEITPKPASKIQKISLTPEYDSSLEKTSILKAERDESECESMAENKKEKKSKRKNKARTTVTVQQLMAEYKVDIDHDSLRSKIKAELTKSEVSRLGIEEITDSKSEKCDSEEAMSSCVSSKNMRDDLSVISQKSSRMDWQSDLEDIGSRNATDCDSRVNVVAKIDMLPFMGSPECEWESSSADTWSFRLLHSRLRLVVRLAHRHDNAARTTVRADTPINKIVLDIVHHEQKNTLACLCVAFAAGTMRWAMRRGCSTAAEVPALVRRLAAVARLAVRWGRAMNEARARLAYTLHADGSLALKVANIPLRSVWEVTMQLELSKLDSEAPYPRASDVRVTRVLADCDVGGQQLANALAVRADWGHAPRTIWRIYRYLKQKTRNEDFVTGT